MKTKLFIALALVSLLLTGQHSRAAEPSTATTELKELVTKVRGKLKEGKKMTEADLADELKEFDALLAKHKAEKTDDVAQILLMKAQLYSQIFDDSKKADELMAQLVKEFPDSKQADNYKQSEGIRKIQSTLTVGAKFPDFDEKDVTGKPVSVAKYKGKVVLIDFWATWCGPCIAELPNVLKAYEKHHAKGFEIIGISLDREQAKLDAFTKEKKMPWQQFFDGKGNKLATKYGVNSIPMTYLLDGEGKIIGKGDELRGEALEQAVAKALGKS